MKSLENAENLCGNLKKENQDRIKKFIVDPTYDTWDDIFSIIINKHFTTIWEAVLELKPSFPSKGRVYDEQDNILKEWSEIPTPLEVLQAIKNATTKD